MVSGKAKSPTFSTSIPSGSGPVAVAARCRASRSMMYSPPGAAAVPRSRCLVMKSATMTPTTTHIQRFMCVTLSTRGQIVVEPQTVEGDGIGRVADEIEEDGAREHAGQRHRWLSEPGHERPIVLNEAKRERRHVAPGRRQLDHVLVAAMGLHRAAQLSPKIRRRAVGNGETSRLAEIARNGLVVVHRHH